jgi:nitrogen regulatory protein PII
MKLIVTIIRPDRLPEVKAALFRAGVTGITLSRVVGHGGERDLVQQYRAETVVLEFHEKVRIEIAVSRNLPAGTVAVDVAQPLGRLAFYLLEPRSDDGLLNWGFMDDALSDGYPITRRPAP